MIAELKQWVQLKLTQDPKYRDSNERLYHQYLKESGYDIDNKSAKQLLKDMSKRRIPYLDSIGRASRLVQEEYPHLRGKYYGKRKTKSIDIKHEILAQKR